MHADFVEEKHNEIMYIETLERKNCELKQKLKKLQNHANFLQQSKQKLKQTITGGNYTVDGDRISQILEVCFTNLII